MITPIRPYMITLDPANGLDLYMPATGPLAGISALVHNACKANNHNKKDGRQGDNWFEKKEVFWHGRIW